MAKFILSQGEKKGPPEMTLAGRRVRVCRAYWRVAPVG